MSKEKLVEDHWSYIRDLLKAHGINKELIKMCKFHYKTAFAHGYKHAKEEVHVPYHYYKAGEEKNGS